VHPGRWRASGLRGVQPLSAQAQLSPKGVAAREVTDDLPRPFLSDLEVVQHWSCTVCGEGPVPTPGPRRASTQTRAPEGAVALPRMTLCRLVDQSWDRSRNRVKLTCLATV